MRVCAYFLINGVNHLRLRIQSALTRFIVVVDFLQLKPAAETTFYQAIFLLIHLNAYFFFRVASVFLFFLFFVNFLQFTDLFRPPYVPIIQNKS